MFKESGLGESNIRFAIRLVSQGLHKNFKAAFNLVLFHFFI
jgi:hypothetical protein